MKSRSELRLKKNREREREELVYTDSPRLADGSIPILPVIIEASSDRISPNMLFVTIVSNCNFRELDVSTLYTLQTL